MCKHLTDRSSNLALVKSENRLAVTGDFGNFLTLSLKAHACFDRPEMNIE